MISPETSAEIRGWTLLVFAVIGGVITVLAFLQNQRQRRLENSFRLLALFKESISQDDRDAWVDLYHATSEPAGAPAGYLISENQERIPLSCLFAEGPPDNGAIRRMAEYFEMIAIEAADKTVNLRFLYYHLGHYMNKIYEWISLFPEGNGDRILEEDYPAFRQLFTKRKLRAEWKFLRHAITG